MAAAQHRPHKPNMFRRILSPRDHHKGKQEKPRSSTLSEVSANGHRRDDLQGSLEVENTQYRDPEHLHQALPPPPGRTQSLVYPNSGDSRAPSLPPRNARPVSLNSHPLGKKQSDDEDECAVYVEPANTLKRDPSAASNYTEVEHTEAVPTKQDIKQMTMYKQTMEQKQGGGHRRVRSFGHVIDKSEYSTPFDLLEQNERAKQRGEEVLPPSVRATLSQPQRSVSDKPPPKPRRIRQTEPMADADSRIPIVSPTPPSLPYSDRSHTNSPSSPHSTHSSEQEAIRDDGTNDYDDPWDNKFKDLPRVRTTTKSDTHLDSRAAAHRHTHPHHHTEAPLVSDRGSSPSPLPHEQPRRSYRDTEQVTISPDQHTDRSIGFIKGGIGRNSGRREGSSSPLPPARDTRSISAPHPPHLHHSQHRFDHPESVARASSMSMAGRQLPPTPSEVTERRILGRDVSPPLVIIDASIPLEDQPWYHGPITRAQAEAILADQPDFSFLVRNSESSSNYSLSIRDYTSGFIHLRMILESGPTPGYVLGQFSGNFNTVQECISFYTKQKLNIRGAEHKKLGLPIPRANNITKYRM